MLSTNLRGKLKETVKDYPTKVIVPVPDPPLQGTAFFPGGDGVYKEDGMSNRGPFKIMVLGQDYDNEENFKKVRCLKTQSELENHNRTWLNLINILGKETLSQCFFTNAIMGLRKGDEKNTGRSKAFAKGNEEFLNQNMAFFKEQLKVVQPQTIICLGIQVPSFLGACFPNELGSLQMIRNFRQLDIGFPEGKAQITYLGKQIQLIFLTHPSLFSANAAKRKGVEWERRLVELSL